MSIVIDDNTRHIDGHAIWLHKRGDGWEVCERINGEEVIRATGFALEDAEAIACLVRDIRDDEAARWCVRSLEFTVPRWWLPVWCAAALFLTVKAVISVVLLASQVVQVNDLGGH
jgi:hypothetical protein